MLRSCSPAMLTHDQPGEKKRGKKGEKLCSW